MSTTFGRPTALMLLMLVVGAAPVGAQTTALFLDSEAGDPIGGGRRQTWTEADMAFAVQQSAPWRIRIYTAALPPSSLSWSFEFAAVRGLSLAVGDYENAGRLVLNLSTTPGMTISGNGVGCGVITGRFRIHEIEFDGTGTLTRLAVDFEQHCQDITPALFGALRYNSSRASLVPFDGAYPVYSLHIDRTARGYVTGPGMMCGTSFTDCDETYGAVTTVALQAVPVPGYVFAGWAGLDCAGTDSVTVTVARSRRCTPVFSLKGNSRPIEPDPALPFDLFLLDGIVGNGESPMPSNRQQHVFTSHNSLIYSGLYPAGPDLEMRIEGPRGTEWRLQIGPPSGGGLAPGSYDYTVDRPTLRGPHPLLALSGNISCGPGGRFRIYEIGFTDDGGLSQLAVDFEQRCSSGLVAGAIRYHSTRQLFVPFDGAFPGYTIQVVPSIGGSVTSAGIACGAGQFDCDESFSSATSVTLHASPLPGYDFLAWTGSCAGAEPQAAVLVDRPQRCFAVFNPSRGSPEPADPSFGNGAIFVDLTSPNGSSTRKVWLPTDSTFSALVSGNEVFFWATSVTSFDYISLLFRAPSGQLVPGDYDEAYPSPGNAPYARLHLNPCSQRASRFRVYEVTFDSSGQVATFAADFEAYCVNSNLSYIAGSIRYHAARATLLPFDGVYPVYSMTIRPAAYGNVTAQGIDCGPGHADCNEVYSGVSTIALVATPSPGYRFVGWSGACDGGPSTTVSVTWVMTCAAVFNRVPFTDAPEDARLAAAALFIDSRPGDRVGRGRRHVWLEPEISGTSAVSGQVVRISARTPDAIDGGRWSFAFRGSGTSPLTPGVYENAIDDVYGSTIGPALRVEAPSDYCFPTGIVGRFVVYEVSVDSTQLVRSFAADFEYRCAPDAPALYGSIRFNSSRSELKPFAPAKPPADFTGDLWPDLLFQNRADGRLIAWAMNGATRVSEMPLAPSAVDPNWHIVGTGDANRDGQMDIYWHHQPTGHLVVWLMNGGTFSANEWISPTPVSDTQWKVRTVADMDQDGFPDLVWQHTGTGGLAIWFMAGTRRVSTGTIAASVPDPAWVLAAAADLNGDSYPDFLWHNTTTGELVVWYMRNASIAGEEALTPDRLSDTSWRLRGAIDLDRNGSPDLIWQNLASGDVATWLMSGTTVIGGQFLGPALTSADWVVVSPR